MLHFCCRENGYALVCCSDRDLWSITNWNSLLCRYSKNLCTPYTMASGVYMAVLYLFLAASLKWMLLGIGAHRVRRRVTRLLTLSMVTDLLQQLEVTCHHKVPGIIWCNLSCAMLSYELLFFLLKLCLRMGQHGEVRRKFSVVAQRMHEGFHLFHCCRPWYVQDRLDLFLWPAYTICFNHVPTIKDLVFRVRAFVIIYMMTVALRSFQHLDSFHMPILGAFHHTNVIKVHTNALDFLQGFFPLYAAKL